MANFTPYYINIKGRLTEISHPWVMGILNVTPDSFYNGNRYTETAAIEARVRQIVDEGAEIIDIGGYSSRPNADDISPDEEYARLRKGLAVIRRIVPEAIVSVDTFRADVARRCVEEFGVEMINDISGGDLDSRMFDTVAELKVAYVLMHMRGNPHTMTSLTHYDNVTADVIKDLGKKIHVLAQKGVNDIIVDPGFGFSKTVEQNFTLFNHLEEFAYLDLPLLVGISRKSMIYKSLDTDAEHSLNGTTVMNTIAIAKGAHILRVHDVKAAVEAVKLSGLMMNAKNE